MRGPKKRAYLVALSRSWNFAQAALAAGVDRGTGYNWRQNVPPDPAFMTALTEANNLFVERAEAEMWRRGIDGVEKPVYQQGRMVGTVREFDTTAAIFMLKGAKPDKYRDRFGLEHSGPNGGPMVTKVTFGGRYKPPSPEAG